MISSTEVAEKLSDGKTGVFLCGNGGSMAQAQHFAAELVGVGVPAMAASDPSVLSALANDDGFQNVFSSYLSAFRGRFDLFIGLTTSGSSNVLRAAGLANSLGMSTILITGASMVPSAIIDLHIRFEGDTQAIQEHTLQWIHEVYVLLKEIRSWTSTERRSVLGMPATLSPR